MFSYSSAVTECQRMGKGYTIKKMWYGWIVTEVPNLITGENKMNNTQQHLSWSDWHEQLFAKLSAKQKEVLNRNTKTVYSFYKSGKLPEEVVAYVCGGGL